MTTRGWSLLYTLSHRLAIAAAVCILVLMTSFPATVSGGTPPEVLDINTNENGSNTTWFNLANHAGKRIVIQLVDRLGGVTASVSASQSSDWDFRLVASQVTLPGGINDRRSVFLFEATVPAGMPNHPIISSEVLDSSSEPVTHSRIGALIDADSSYTLAAVSGADSGVSAVASQSSGTTGAVPAGNIFIIAPETTRGSTTTLTRTLTTHQPDNPGGGTWDLFVSSGSAGNNQRRGSMGYYAGNVTAAQTWEEELSIDPNRQVSTLIAVWTDGTGSGNSIQMSSASQSAEEVDYRLRLVEMENIQSMVIDFCSNSPLAGTDCAAPTGMDTGNVDIGSGSGDWNAASGGAPNRIELSKDTTHSSGPISLIMTGVDNPSEVGTFYARVLLYEDETNDYSSPTDVGETAQTVAIALAITDDIGVTLIIPEYVDFCVYNIECGDAPAIVLGEDGILNTSQVDSGSVQFEVATNAILGVALRVKGTTLTMGSSEIPPACTIDTLFDPDLPRGYALEAGSAAFGMEVIVDGFNPANPIGANQLIPHPSFLDWDFNSSTSYGDYAFFGGCGEGQGYGTEPNSPYGGIFATSTEPLEGSTGDLIFRAAISGATAAGTYDTTLQVIVTGYY